MKEFNFKASSLGFYKLMLFGILYLLAGLIIGQKILPHMHFVRLLLSGVIMLIFLQLTLFIYKYNLKIIFKDNDVIIYKNDKLLIKSKIHDIEKFQTRDINSSHAIGDFRLFIKDKKNFYFSLLIVSRDKTKNHQEKILRALIIYFIEKHNFCKRDHMTKLGKSKYLFEYINPNFYKNE